MKDLKMLQLNHVLSVNHPEQARLSREQVWNGLMLKVLEPLNFTIGMDHADILEQGDAHYRRALHFGDHVVHDTVTLTQGQAVEFVTDATDQVPSGRLLIEIVGEADADLKLSFTYTTAFPEPSSDEERGLLDMVKGAYTAADMDMIRIIREHALMARH